MQKKHVKYERLEFINHSSVKAKVKRVLNSNLKFILNPSFCAKFKLKQIIQTQTHMNE